MASQVRALLTDTPWNCPDLHRPCWTASGWSGREPTQSLEIGQVLLDEFEIMGFLSSGGVARSIAPMIAGKRYSSL